MEFEDENTESDVCPECGGTGEVTVMEQVWPNEPYTADVGTQACICTLQDRDDL